jgi:hypothetical protein
MVVINAINAINRKMYDIGKFIIDIVPVMIVSVDEMPPNRCTSTPLMLIFDNIYDNITQSIPDIILINLICDVEIIKNNIVKKTIKIKNDIGISFIEKITTHIWF